MAASVLPPREPGFAGAELALELEALLPCLIDDKMNPLVEDIPERGPRARTVDEIAAWLEDKVAGDDSHV